MLRAAAVVFAFLSAVCLAPAQEAAGEAAVADRYFRYALTAAERGAWEEAEKTLIRSLDYADVSSDIPYLLAVARRRLSRPVSSALAAVRLSLAASRFRQYSREEAILLQADCLVVMRAFEEARMVLALLPNGPDRLYLSIKAAAGLADWNRFRELLRTAIEAHPHDPRFLRLLFKHAGPGPGASLDARLMDVALKRLPFLIEADPVLTVWAAPFIADLAERKRVIAAYRAAAPDPVAASLPLAVSLGLLDEEDAASELFAAAEIDISVLRSLHAALRSPRAREKVTSLLKAFAGTIVDDSDGDEVAETTIAYRDGLPVSLSYDADQDGLMELTLEFADGLPIHGRVAFGVDSAGDRSYADLTWERFPFVASTRAAAAVYYFPPAGFPFAPVRFAPILPYASVLYPEIESPLARLTERSLLSFASALERAGTLAPGAIERIEYRAGVPLRAVETVGGITASITDFEDGYPVLTRLDRDLDGRFDATKRYRPRSIDVSTIELDQSIERSTR